MLFLKICDAKNSVLAFVVTIISWKQHWQLRTDLPFDDVRSSGYVIEDQLGTAFDNTLDILLSRAFRQGAANGRRE